ncbi:hypothetical protein [Brevibacillus parabrevis]|uniref:hypothetical protein n=1 Tax=Brevibacillus parabrevis TaxID=54914 RepID=UPI002380425C|nr:hypothetical protein [Brevibacillus parabrevis]WDV94876.1 hypothetical protein PSE45_25085 [Brevibacillus parabrevis]
MKKSLLVPLFLSFSLLFTGTVSAQTNPDYGTWPYYNDGNNDFLLKGNLTPSGISDGQQVGRYTNLLWHAMTTVNTETNEFKPINPGNAQEVGSNSGEFTPTITFEILPKDTGETIRDSGYHLLPADEATIRKYATNANGNADFVWNAITWPMSSGQYDSNAYGVKYYNIRGKWFVSVPIVMQLSGGGNPTEDYLRDNDGVSAPRIVSTYKVTPWPFIYGFEGREKGVAATKISNKGALYIDAKTWSVYDKEANIGFAINGKWIDEDGDARVDAVDRLPNNNAGEYTVTYQKAIPVSTPALAKNLKVGKNKIIARVFDKYGRFVNSPEIEIEYVPGDNLLLENPKVTPPGDQEPGTPVNVCVDVKAQLVSVPGPINAKATFKDGAKSVGNKTISAADDETVPVCVPYTTQPDDRVHTEFPSVGQHAALGM